MSTIRKKKPALPATPPVVKKVPRKRKFDPPQLLKGMKDVLPEEQQYRQAIIQKLEAIAVSYGYQRIDTPIAEQEGLFRRSIGEVTDIVEKEMYTFEDKSGDWVALRPEFTAGIARAYIEHGMINRTQPVKLYTMGPLFRHDRPQAGRYRQFNQLDFEVIGEGQPVIDAELIAIGCFLFRDLGLDVTVQINSVGDAQCRPQYIQALQEYYRPKRKNLCENCKLRFTKNPLRLLDCKEPVCQEMSQDAPQIVDHLCAPCRDHFVKVLEILDETQVQYTLNPKIVRGLDYYTRTAWEFFPVVEADAQLGSQSALAGGGRYDALLEQLGSNVATPASGFAAGIERVILEMKTRNIALPGLYTTDVFLAQLGESAQKRSIALMEQLRQAGFKVWANLVKESLSSQLKIADKCGAKFTLILGQKELIDGTIIIRDMDSGSQEIIDVNKLEKELGKRLSKYTTPTVPKMIGPYAEVELNPQAQAQAVQQAAADVVAAANAAKVADAEVIPPTQEELPLAEQ